MKIDFWKMYVIKASSRKCMYIGRKHLKAWLVLWKYPLRRLNLIPIEIFLRFDLNSPKTLTNRNFSSLHPIRYAYGGHVSYYVIIPTKVKPQMRWKRLPQAKDKISFILCLHWKKLSVHGMG